LPVVLVHGIFDTSKTLRKVESACKDAGLSTHAITFSRNLGFAPLSELAEELREFIASRLEHASRFDLFGFSMGGLVSRYYIQRLGGLGRVRTFLSISAPHHGSALACVWPGSGSADMRPGSAFLTDLASDASRLREVRFISYYTPYDLTILPPTSSIMPEAENRRRNCPAHPLMVLQSSLIREYVETLRCERG
jgi:triacylglycerol lipase